ncbi:hypothetical protein FXO38_13803 [Capsicum annuum]|nr:hypothetical protein FXO37_15269 [Capsicum annuum]KAF3657172.1 hypothetical protein FXO38_13803 [Capsicum annuum]
MVNSPIVVRHCYRECSVVADALAKFGVDIDHDRTFNCPSGLWTERGYNAMVFEPPVEMREIIRDRPPLALPVERQQDRFLQLLPRGAPFSLRNPEAYILVQTFPLRPISREECANHGICNSVANSTSATFVCVVGSELIQKHLGDGPKFVRDIFRVVDDLSPGIFPPLSVLAVAAKEAKSPVSLSALPLKGGLPPNFSHRKLLVYENYQLVLDPKSAIMAYYGHAAVIPADPVAYSATARIQDFTRMNPPSFLGSKSDEDPQEFIDQDVSHTWFKSWKSERPDGTGPIEWEEFAIAFLERFFPLELREAKVLEFINLSVVNKCRSAILNSDMNLARLMTYAQQIEDQKIKMKEKQNKRAKTGSFNFAKPKSEGGNHSQFHPKSSVLVPSSPSALAHKFRDRNRDRVPGSKS